jgi:hypothetical protein
MMYTRPGGVREEDSVFLSQHGSSLKKVAVFLSHVPMGWEGESREVGGFHGVGRD